MSRRLSLGMVAGVDGAIFLITAVNTIFWGLAVRQLKQLSISPGALVKMATNPYFVLAMVTGLMASVASYYLLSQMGLTVGRFFSSIGFVAVVVANYVAFNDKPSLPAMVGIGLVLAGVVVLGLFSGGGQSG